MAVALVVATLTACDGPVRRLERSGPETTTTSTRAASTSKPWFAPRTSTSTISGPTSSRAPVDVPDPASNKACRLLDWNDLPADVRPTKPTGHTTFTDDPEMCQIDDTIFRVNPDEEPTIYWFRVTTIVSPSLSPIDRLVGADAESTGRLTTVGGRRAVERVWPSEAMCAVYLEPAPEPFR